MRSGPTPADGGTLAARAHVQPTAPDTAADATPTKVQEIGDYVLTRTILPLAPARRAGAGRVRLAWLCTEGGGTTPLAA